MPSSGGEGAAGIGEGHVSWSGLGCIAVGAVFGYGSHVYKREGIRLRSIPRYTDFRLLERDLMAAAGVAAAAAQTVDVTNPRQSQIQSPSPGMLVAVSGAATADTLVKCLHSRQSNGAPQTCIYYDAISEQHVARQTDRGEWIRDSAVVSHMTAESPVWQLEDGTGGAVNMHRATAFGGKRGAR